MSFIPALNSKGRFSSARVRQEVNKLTIVETKKTKPRFSFFWIIVGITAIMLGLLTYASVASAAVFDGINFIDITGKYELDHKAPNNYILVNFATTTAQIELTDLTVLSCMVSTEPATTTTIFLSITTNQGTWTASSTNYYPQCALPIAYATTTFIFPSGDRPYNLVGGGFGDDPFRMSFYTIYDGVSYGVGLIQSSASTSWITTDVYVSSTYSYTGTLPPQMRINDSGLGVNYPIPTPNADDYGLYGTSSAMTQDLGFFGNMFRDLMIWLFQPSEGIKEYYNDQKNTLLNEKVPFAYFAAASSTLGSVSTTTDGAELVAGVTTTLGYFELINTANIRANPLMDVLDIIKFWFRVALWAAFLFYLYYTIKEFKP